MEAKIAVDDSSSHHVLSVDRASEQDARLIDEFSRLPLIFSGLPTPESITELAFVRNNDAPDAFADNGAPYKLFHSGPFDYLFSAITANTTHIDSLLDPDTLIAAVQTQWSQYFARLVDFYMRVPADEEPPVAAVLEVPQQRIFVNAKPARILEGLLGSVFLCVVVLSLTIDAADILPREPYSIASRMALLADSELVRLPELKEPDAHLLSAEELAARLSTTWFRLGWWEGGSDEKGVWYGINIEHVDHEAGASETCMMVDVRDL